MLKPLLIQSLHEFTDDYNALCTHHYPTIHNRGMSPPHLSSAFHRRLRAIMNRKGLHGELTPLTDDTAPHLCVFLLRFNEVRLWLLYPQFLNAKTEAKIQIYNAIENLQHRGDLLPEDHLMVLCDHWFDRTRSSKELYHWWTGGMPKDMERYVHQGVHHLASKTTLEATISNLSMTCLTHSIIHPLESNQQHVLLKYFLCFGLFRYTIK